jgi:hypothetical protein
MIAVSTRKMRKQARKQPRKNIHHRRPKAQGGSNRPENLSVVDTERHSLWTQMFDGTMTPKEIIDDINNKWIDERYMVVLIERRSGNAI